MIEFTPNPRTQLGQLWRLRGKLTLRQFTGERGRIVGAAIVVFFIGPLVLAAAYGSGIGYRRLDNQWPTALLGGVLTLLWIIWLIFPILFASINEGADIPRLMISPIPRRTIIASVILGTLFDYPTYLMLPLFAAIIYGFGLSLSPVTLVVIAALVLGYGHLIMIGQLAGTTIGGIMQSRRVRDVAIIFFSLIGGLCYFINVGIQRLLEAVSHQISADDVTAFQAWQPLDVLQWLPPGALAQAVAQARAGDWLASLLWLGYSLVWLILITWVWYKLLVRLTTGEGYLLTPRLRQETRRQAVREERRERNLLGWLPPTIAQLTANEFKSVWRVPQRRVGIIQGVLMPIFFLGAFFLGGDTEFGAAPRWMALTLPAYAIFLFWANTQNMLAWEGPGLPALLLTPVPRQHIFRAKGLALFVITAVPLLLFGGLIVYNNPGWLSVAGLLTALGMGVATMGVTAVASVYFPIPIRLEGRRKRCLFQSGGDTKTGCAYITIVPLSVVLVSAPAAAPLLLAYWLDVPWLAAPGLFFSAAYAFAVFWIGTRKAGELLLAREPEVVERLKLPEE